MFLKTLVIGTLGALACASSNSQTPQAAPTPATIRLIAPHSRGALLIDTSGGWELDRAVLYANGQRPVVQMHNDQLHLIASWILDDEPQYNDTADKCRSDMLGGVIHGLGKSAQITDKANGQITTADGQTLLTGSYYVKKLDGQEMREQVLWGFTAAHHLCAAIHLSRVFAKAGDNSPFEPVLKAFHFDPDYQATSADRAAMAALLPPQMAALYTAGTATNGASSNATAAPAAPLTADASNQTLGFRPHSLELALPGHPGRVEMDAPGYTIAELSAKPNGREFGIRAYDPELHTEALVFLFVTDPAHPTAVACRDWMLQAEAREAKGRKLLKQYEQTSTAGTPLAVAEYESTKANPNIRFTRRVFAASGDLCLDLSLAGPSANHIGPSEPMVESLRFDPAREPDFFAVFRYAQVLFEHKDIDDAAPLFERAIPLAKSAPDALKWQRVATDQAAISFGIAGNLASSRAVAEAGIARDPDYPLNYYNLACADAEQGNAAAARQHLEQAYARSANTLPGESMPDATQDDSLQKLKSEKTFWGFVESLPKPLVAGSKQ